MLALGLMSGTSQDGVDAVLAEFSAEGRFVTVRAALQHRYPDSLRQALLPLSRESHAVSARQWAELDRGVADVFADAALALLEGEALPPGAVTILGSHGQTVFHDPIGVASSLQLGDPARIAIRTGIATVADFRRADVALGGQGAPLAPGFHHAVFASPDEARGVLNLGGIANLTVLPGLDPAQVIGFDTGPANALMDDWAALRFGQPFDANGRIAASGRPHLGFLNALLADPYYSAAPPKSTGRGQFCLDAARSRFPNLDGLPAEDVQCSFLELTVETVAGAIEAWAPRIDRVLVCGGGVSNTFLMLRLAERLPGIRWASTTALGIHPQHIEGAAFAWLAVRRLLGLPGALPLVTGASRATVLGGLYLPTFELSRAEGVGLND